MWYNGAWGAANLARGHVSLCRCIIRQNIARNVAQPEGRVPWLRERYTELGSGFARSTCKTQGKSVLKQKVVDWDIRSDTYIKVPGFLSFLVLGSWPFSEIIYKFHFSAYRTEYITHFIGDWLSSTYSPPIYPKNAYSFTQRQDPRADIVETLEFPRKRHH